MQRASSGLNRKTNVIKKRSLFSPIKKEYNTFHLNMTLQKYITMRLNDLNKSKGNGKEKKYQNEKNENIKSHKMEILLLKEENIKLNQELNEVKKLYFEKNKEFLKLKELIYNNDNNISNSIQSINQEIFKNYISSNTINSLDISDSK